MALEKKWAHLVAVGGTGMGALAALLQDLGWVVTGSDGPLYPPMSTFLQDRSIPVATPYSADNLSGSAWTKTALSQSLGTRLNPDLVIVGNAISRGHPEADVVERLVAEQKTQRMSFAEALAEFAIRDCQSLVVCGTHGKTTTTTMAAWLLESEGCHPGFFIGGIPKNFGFGARLSTGKVFVSEGDEYDTAYWDKGSKFLHYKPHWALCTGIEFDHADIFKDLNAVVTAFEKLIPKTREGFVLIDAKSAPRADTVERLASRVRESTLRLVRYGEDPASDFCLEKFEVVPLPWASGRMGALLQIRIPGDRRLHLISPMLGRHNALNLVGVIAMLSCAGRLGDQRDLQTGLESFLGIRRRQDEVYSDSSLVVIDDFAHHPTAIRETISAVRQLYPNTKLAAFFEARSATSARNILASDLEASFDEADSIFLVPPTKTNVPLEEKLDIVAAAAAIQKRAANGSKTIVVKSDVNELASEFKSWTQSLKDHPRVVALVMSNGGFGGIHKLLSDAVGAPARRT